MGEEPAPAPSSDDTRTIESTVATLALSVVGEEVRILFTPVGGYHLYAPGAPDSDPIRVEGVDAAGTTWKPAVHPSAEAGEIREPYEVRSLLAHDRCDGRLRVPRALAGLQRLRGLRATRGPPTRRRARRRRLAHRRRSRDAAPHERFAPSPAAPSSAGTGPASPAPPSTPAGADLGEVPGMAAAPPSSVPTISSVAPTGLLFPVDGERKAQSWIEGKWKDWGLLFLGPIFLVGLLLAFTPCVLPLIPITVSIVGGSQENPVARGRMTVLLSSYVLGLALAFGALGLAASFGGASLSAAFKSPYALWGIAGIFVVLAFGMFGVYEMQPPAALQRLMGGAKGGSVVGSFLFGALSAVIASPCTGPVIAGMLIFAAQSGNVLLGFLMFFSLGLGMGAVFFLAGSVNLLMKPGPWMVWVRHGFGVMLVGGGLYTSPAPAGCRPRTCSPPAS